MKKKIVFVINYFYPDVASTGQLMTELCLNLQEDFDITVIASQPDYAGQLTQENERHLYENLENIKIIRIRTPKVNKSSKSSRIKYILSYFFLALKALLKEKRVDVIYTISQPPILGGLIGALGKIMKKSKFVYNIQDFNPEQVEAVGYSKSNIIIGLARFLDNLSCLVSDKVIVVGNDMKLTLENRFKGKTVPSNVVINNWINEKEVYPIKKENREVSTFLDKHGIKDKFVVMYSGNLGLYYDLENIIKVTERFKLYEDIVFVFIGEGAVKTEMVNYVNEKRINNVLFLPYEPKERIKYSLNSADVHLVINQKGIKGVSVPSKIYGVMAVGKPILGVLESGSEASNLIKESKSGIVVEPNDYSSITQAIEEIYKMDKFELDKMGEKGRFYLEKNLKMESSIQKYKNVLQGIVKEN